jgi:hypothetical protein
MVKYSNNSGDTTDDAIKISDVSDNMEGIQSEYTYLEEKFGEPGKDWHLQRQALIRLNERSYDEMTIKLPNGEVKKIYFDITSFIGKM